MMVNFINYDLLFRAALCKKFAAMIAQTRDFFRRR